MVVDRDLVCLFVLVGGLCDVWFELECVCVCVCVFVWSPSPFVCMCESVFLSMKNNDSGSYYTYQWRINFFIYSNWFWERRQKASTRVEYYGGSYPFLHTPHTKSLTPLYAQWMTDRCPLPCTHFFFPSPNHLQIWVIDTFRFSDAFFHVSLIFVSCFCGYVLFSFFYNRFKRQHQQRQETTTR